MTRFRPALAMLAIGACSGDPQRPLRPPPGPKTGTVEIHASPRLTGISTDKVDALGRPLRVACVTCHSLRRAESLPTSTGELDQFHQGLEVRHGVLTCGTCHVVGDQRSLRLADGTLVAMVDAIALCRQCHGPQARDYDHGSHGGMNGYWDLSAGNRVRNHCVDCHDPHAPAFQPSRPVAPPRDRGVAGGR